jgi:WD40 repeat protein
MICDDDDNDTNGDIINNGGSNRPAVVGPAGAGAPAPSSASKLAAAAAADGEAARGRVPAPASSDPPSPSLAPLVASSAAAADGGGGDGARSSDEDDRVENNDDDNDDNADNNGPPEHHLQQQQLLQLQQQDQADAAALGWFTDDELLEVLRHLGDDDDEDDDYDNAKKDGGEENDNDGRIIGRVFAGGGEHDEPEEEEDHHQYPLPLPDLDWYMDSDDPNDPLAFLGDDDDVDPDDDYNNSKGLMMLLEDWEEEGDNDDSLLEGTGDRQQPQGGARIGGHPQQQQEEEEEDDDARMLMTRDWTAHSSSASPTTGSDELSTTDANAVRSSLRPDMFWDDDLDGSDDPMQQGTGRTNVNTAGSDDVDDEGGGVMELLDQLGDLTLVGEDDAAGGWDPISTSGAVDATTQQSTTTSSTAAAGAKPAAARGGSEERDMSQQPAEDVPPNDLSRLAAMRDDDGEDDDHLPDYLYCQPCTPRHVQEEQQEQQQQAIQALQAEPHLLLSPSDEAEYIGGDPWEQYAEQGEGCWEDDFAARLTLRDADKEGDEDPAPRRRRKVRPEAQSAVQFLLDTFDASINDDELTGAAAEPSGSSSSPEAAGAAHTAAAPPLRERIGIGHRERILGMDASECGRFVATAGQDGTAKVWDAKNHRVLATIVHNPDHPNDHECLRVAFAPVSWGFHRLPASLAMLPTAAEAVATTMEQQQQQQQQQAGLSQQESRYLLATGGADGRVCVWSCLNPSLSTSSWTLQCQLDHAQRNRYFVPESDTDTPQIYSLQFVSHWRGLPTAPHETQNSFLLTSSDDFVHLWEIVPPPETDMMSSEMTERIVELVQDDDSNVGTGSARDLKLQEVMSIRFGDMREAGWGVRVCSVTEDGLVVEPSDEDDGHDDVAGGCAHAADEQHWKFGGDRNPHHLVYVFDGRYCASNGLLAVALSDGTLRLVNGRGVCVTLLHLPGLNSHLTSFAFDSAGTRLATTVATGHVILWNLVFGHDKEQKVDDSEDAGADTKIVSDDVLATCQAVLSGHDVGRPVFGAAYCGTNEDVLVSWGVDGRICAWDSRTEGEADGPLSVLLHKPDYPVYAVSLRPDGLAVAGGGSDESFVGIPVYFYDFAPSTEGDDQAIGAANPAPDVKIVEIHD